MGIIYSNNEKFIEFRLLCDVLCLNKDRSVIGRIIKDKIRIINGKKYCNYWTANIVCNYYNIDSRCIDAIYERSDKLIFLCVNIYRKLQTILKYECKNNRVCK